MLAVDGKIKKETNFESSNIITTLINWSILLSIPLRRW